MPHALDGPEHTGTLGAGQHTTQPPDQHHPQAHSLGGADHTGSLAAGQHGDRSAEGGTHHSSAQVGGHPQAHQADHQAGGADALAGNLDAGARVTIRKNSGANLGTRRRLNLIEGTNVTLTVTDDAVDEEVDITISAAGAAGAPSTAPYVTIANDPGLSAERVLTAGDGLNLTDGGAEGAATLDVRPYESKRLTVAGRTYTNQGAGPTESSNADRITADLAGSNECRLVGFINVAGVTAVLKAQYSTDAAETWADLTGTIATTPTGHKQSAWAAVPVGAKVPVQIRLVATGGNTTEDPQLRSGASVEFR